ncbi:hypothetical protein [Nocardia arthritidis]|uniref:Uncharacterized protein n=1 Tax=Nocardia arthritidis TaxID=228602 RepID=A0A6G9YS06_9NOCA|nr:hypothetical protein [Nocardia arthritidis]QIS16095.1 hypothetical protein F5544_41425 [Nocardia arthritidis]
MVVKIEGSKAYQEFVKEQSRAFSRHFFEFIWSRNLDIEDEFWSEQDKADFNAESDLLLAEWKRREAEMWAAEESDDRAPES